jgi:hypothetical protein
MWCSRHQKTIVDTAYLIRIVLLSPITSLFTRQRARTKTQKSSYIEFLGSNQANLHNSHKIFAQLPHLNHKLQNLTIS